MPPPCRSPAWTPATDGPVRVLGVRDTVDAVFSILDPISETSTILDAWASQLRRQVKWCATSPSGLP